MSGRISIVRYTPEEVTYQATRATWAAVLETMPERAAGEDRPFADPVRAAIVRAQGTPDAAPHVTLPTRLARWMMDRYGR
jgi:hypothetical protein